MSSKTDTAKKAIKNATATETSEASQVQLDPALTLALAIASLDAYWDYECKPYACPPNYKFLARFTGWDEYAGDLGAEERYGLIFKYCGPQQIANRFIVAFRGTDTYSDMFEDAFWESATFTPYRNSTSPAADDIASGFYSVYSTKGGSMAATMQQQIFSLLPEQPSEVIVTGHSLGGALSQLFTLDMRVSSPNVSIKTINFASPRVGGEDWQAACDNAGATSKITRVINYYDYVPDFPQAILDIFDNYVSIGAEFQTAFYGEDWAFFDELHRHSMLNLQIVLNNCVWLNPQIWVGTFSDAQDPSYQMWSVGPPDFSKEALVANIRSLHALEKSARAAKSRSTPFAGS
ncbi:MAG TPA: lipase family protein [Blastocatellia bacterium]|nr:lipase family protein [Blastocatellia bacterium]